MRYWFSYTEDSRGFDELAEELEVGHAQRRVVRVASKSGPLDGRDEYQVVRDVRESERFPHVGSPCTSKPLLFRTVRRTGTRGCVYDEETHRGCTMY